MIFIPHWERYRDKKPEGHVDVNWNNPLTQELVGLWLPSVNKINLVSNFESPIPSSGLYIGELTRESALLTGANVSFITNLKTGAVTTSGTDTLLSQGPVSGGNNQGFALDARHVNASYSGAVYYGTGYSIIGKPTGGALVSNTEYFLGMSVSGTNGAVYNNGLNIASAGSLSARNAAGRVSLGRNSHGADNLDTEPTWYFYYQWNRALSDDEMFALYEAPYQLVKKAPTFFFLGASGVTLSINNLSQSQFLGTIALTQQNVIDLANLSQPQELENVSLTQQNSLTLNSVEQTQELANIELIQQNILGIVNLSQAQTLQNILLTQQNLLSVSGLSQSQTLENISLDLTLHLFPDNVFQEQNLETLALLQAHVLQVEDLTSQQTLNSLNLSVAYTLVVNDLLHSQLLENITLLSDISYLRFGGEIVFIVKDSPTILILNSRLAGK